MPWYNARAFEPSENVTTRSVSSGVRSLQNGATALSKNGGGTGMRTVRSFDPFMSDRNLLAASWNSDFLIPSASSRPPRTSAPAKLLDDTHTTAVRPSAVSLRRASVSSVAKAASLSFSYSPSNSSTTTSACSLLAHSRSRTPASPPPAAAAAAAAAVAEALPLAQGGEANVLPNAGVTEPEAVGDALTLLVVDDGGDGAVVATTGAADAVHGAAAAEAAGGSGSVAEETSVGAAPPAVEPATKAPAARTLLVASTIAAGPPAADARGAACHSFSSSSPERPPCVESGWLRSLMPRALTYTMRSDG